MDDIRTSKQTLPARGDHRPGLISRAWSRFLDFYDGLMTGGWRNLGIIRREVELFLGAALTLVGILGFNSAKFCDGNTADYLSCTRPTAYHYYSASDIILIVVGVFFVLLWFLKRKE